jgi:hypothetical protein
LVKECKNHNINTQLVKLIPITQHAEYSESTIYNNIQDTFILLKVLIKKYINWLKRKTRKLNRLHSAYISKFGSYSSY